MVNRVAGGLCTPTVKVILRKYCIGFLIRVLGLRVQGGVAILYGMNRVVWGTPMGEVYLARFDDTDIYFHIATQKTFSCWILSSPLMFKIEV